MAPFRRNWLTKSILLPSQRQWFFLEIKSCATKMGFGSVRKDANKLLTENPSDPCDPRNGLRGLLVFGFGSAKYENPDHLYRQLGDERKSEGFHEVGIQRKPFEGEATRTCKWGFGYSVLGPRFLEESGLCSALVKTEVRPARRDL
jgi:hypothetical protein